MAQSPLGAQFHGTVALAALSLKRLAQSDDVEAGLAAARKLGALDEDDEQFVRECLALDGQLKSGEIIPAELSYDQASRLQSCISRINSAESA